jgi:hypothetical protein
VTQETDGVLEEMSDSLARDIYRDGNCQLGKRASIAGDVVTLTNADDARYFKKGMTVIASANANGSTPRTGSTTVAKVDEDAGTVTLTDQSQLQSFANSDFLFRDGEQATGMEGLASHLPLAAPSPSENFRGIDRSDDPRRLAGVRVNDTATNIEENAGLVGVKIDQVGQEGKIVMLNPINFWRVSRRLDAKVTYDGGGVKAAYGFEGFDIHSPAGTLRAVSDPFCPTSLGYVLNLECFYIPRLRGLPHIITDDGLDKLRITDEDGIEARMRAVGNLVCVKPGSCGVFAI